MIIFGALLPLWGVNFICKSSLLHSYCGVFIRVTSHVTQPLSWEVLRDEPFPVCKEVLSRMFSRIAITRLLTLGHEKCRSFLSLYCNNLKSAFHTSVLPVKVPFYLYPWPHNFKYLQLYFFKSFFATCRLFWFQEGAFKTNTDTAPTVFSRRILDILQTWRNGVIQNTIPLLEQF